LSSDRKTQETPANFTLDILLVSENNRIERL